MKNTYYYIVTLAMLILAFPVKAASEAEFGKLTKAYTLHADGSQEMRVQKELTLFTHAAMNRVYGESFIIYNPEFQTLKIHDSYTRQKDGTIVKTPENALLEVLPSAAADALAYNGLKEMVVVHTGLELGATIYLDYSVVTRPEYVFGMNMGFDWKGFNFTMQWVGSKNVNRMYDIEYRIPYTNAGKRGLLTYFYDGCWTPENQLGAVYPRPSEESESWNSEPSTLWLVDASYLRLKSLSFGYTITGKKFLKKLGLSSLGLNFSGYNLLTFSPLKYLDPESDPNRFGDYPLIKVYSFGLNLNF